MTEAGSESPRSIRGYHKGGSGSLTGGGVQRIYSSKTADLKEYKRKLDGRLGQCIFIVFLTMATLLCIYGVVHGSVHDPIYTYVNRTHQIVHELENAINENYGGVKNGLHNETLAREQGKQWLTADELADDAHLLRKTRSTIWGLFVANVLLALVLLPVLCIIHLELAEGVYVKLFYRAVLVVCLLFLIAQFLYLIYPLLTAAYSFPSMLDRLFLEAYPRDEYQRRGIEDSLSCQWETNPSLVQFDLQRPCIEKLKNSLLPIYVVILMLLIDVIPFGFAAFTYAWSACIKDKKHVAKARERVQLNNQRRVPIPNTQPKSSYLPDSPTGRVDHQLV